MKPLRFAPIPLAPTWSVAAGIIVLVAFWLLLNASTWNKGITYDELVHAPAGYSYWKYNDYRLNPENGNLPQRIAGLGYLGGKYPLPPATSPAWQLPDEWELGDEWFHHLGYDVPGMLHRGRAFGALQAVAVAALVWLWSRRLFGPIPGLLSLACCALNPTILANGGLITSDTAAALFFLASTWALWALLHRVSPGRVALAALAVGGLFVSKSSAILIVPIGLVLLLARIIEGSPLPVRLGRNSEIRNPKVEFDLRVSRFGFPGVAVFAGLAALLVGTTVTTIWACYGFRYAAFAPNIPSQQPGPPLQEVFGNQSLPEIAERAALSPAALDQAHKLFDRLFVPTFGMDARSDAALAQLRDGILTAEEVRRLDAALAAARPPATARFIQFLARHRLLPEAFLYGTAHAWRFAQFRGAFFNGEFYSTGSSWYFPYTFLVKTPLPFLGLALVALGAAVLARRQPGLPAKGSAAAGALAWKRAFYRTLPLWTLFGLYWIAAVSSRLNIGHRHILTTYPPLFILCGAAGAFLVGRSGSPAVGQSGSPAPPDRLTARLRLAVLVLLGLYAADVGLQFPNYLSYFNGIVAPSEGFRHFVDSTVDWGQDLPGVRTYIDRHPAQAPFHLSYFGNDDPRSYGISATLLPSNPGRFRKTLEPILFLPLDAAGAAPSVDRLQRDYPTHTYVGVGTQGAARYAVLLRKREAWTLAPGTYLISATNLQVPWRDGDEDNYQKYQVLVEPFLAPGPDSAAAIRQHTFAEWRTLLRSYDNIRQARLAAFLKAYIPNDDIGHSILVYKVTAADLERALNGPNPPSGYLNRKLNP